MTTQRPAASVVRRSTLPWWVVILAVVVTIVACAHAHKYRGGGGGVQTTILQVRLEDAAPDLLEERRPLVIEDRLVDPAGSLLSTLLRCQYVWRGPYGEACPVAPAFELARCRFTLVFFVVADDAASSVDIILRRQDVAVAVAVRLVSGRVLVIPPGFSYAVAESPPSSVFVQRLRMHDTATAILSPFLTPA